MDIDRQSRILRMLFITLTALLLGYLSVCVLLYVTQDTAIYFPGPNNPQLREQQQSNRIEIPVAGATLEGWWVENPKANNETAILYFGGNAEDVLYSASNLTQFNARHMLVVNYRSYGGSTGKPGQQALYEDGLATYDYLIQSGVAPRHIVVMGRSLGSGIASMIAATRPVRAAILITPFDSLASVAARHYPWLPIRLLLKHPFPSIEWAKKAHAPALFIAASEDNIVPASHAQKLFDAWQGKKWIHILPWNGPQRHRIAPRLLSADQ
jgi:pimeloyl-ACP methyl ester carboxylesterase